MSILILGAQGNLGSQLVKAVPEAIAWDRNDLDFLDFAELRKRLAELKPNVIINAVAYNQVDKCEAEPGEYELALKLNRDLVGVLVEQDALIVHYSSDYVFSGTATKQEFSETDKPAPINKYGESKLAGEKVLLAQARRYYLIRTSKLFGPPGSSAHSKPSFFATMIKQAETQPQLKVVDSELSCFTYTPDLARATFKMIENAAPSGIYHIINSQPATWYHAALSLFKIKGWAVSVKALKSDDLKRSARRPEYSILKNTKLKPLRDFRLALKEYLS